MVKVRIVDFGKTGGDGISFFIVYVAFRLGSLEKDTSQQHNDSTSIISIIMEIRNR